MGDDDLAALVVAYDDLPTAVGDFNDLATAHREHRVAGYDAAVIQTNDGVHDVVATTITPREKSTLRGAGLGLVVGALFTPALAGALVGGSIGGMVGHIVGRASAFKHSDLQEAERLIGEGPVHLLVIAAPQVVDEVAAVAAERERRVRLSLEPTDVKLLKKELQDPGRPPTL